MRLQTKKILGVEVTTSNRNLILEKTRKYLSQIPKSKFQFSKTSIKPLVIFTPNPEIINFARENPDYRKIVNKAQIKIPDGNGVVWAIKKIHKMQIEVIPGVEMMISLCKMARENGYTAGLIGGRDGLALKVLECLRKTNKKLKVEVLGEPDIQISKSKIQITNIKNEKKYFNDLISEINKRKIDILFVALGFPKQEYFIENVKIQLSKSKIKRLLVLMGVGGSFNYIAGRVRRAPERIRKAGWEWLYRLLREPWRLKRQLAGSKFFLRVFVTN